MPIAYRIDKAAGLTIVVWHGEVTTDDFAAHVSKLTADPDWPPGTRHIGDLTTAITIPVVATPVIVEKFRAAQEWPTIRYALVARAGWEQAADFQQAVEAVGAATFVLFNEVQTACTWLGIDPTLMRAVINELRDQLRTQSN